MSILERSPFHVEVIPSLVKVEQRTRTHKNTGEITPYFLQRVIAHFDELSQSVIEITLNEPTPLPVGKYIFSGQSVYLGKPFGDNPPRLEFNQWNVSYVSIEKLKDLLK
ncbi:hypothetical protein DVQ78_19525 [Yersinia enterocolitica]|nr:hypothetical protein [Yersinia enterocolitica]